MFILGFSLISGLIVWAAVARILSAL